MTSRREGTSDQEATMMLPQEDETRVWGPVSIPVHPQVIDLGPGYHTSELPAANDEIDVGVAVACLLAVHVMHAIIVPSSPWQPVYVCDTCTMYKRVQTPESRTVSSGIKHLIRPAYMYFKA